jgi:hypothetical protein
MIGPEMILEVELAQCLSSELACCLFGRPMVGSMAAVSLDAAHANAARPRRVLAGG